MKNSCESAIGILDLRKSHAIVPILFYHRKTGLPPKDRTNARQDKNLSQDLAMLAGSGSDAVTPPPCSMHSSLRWRPIYGRNFSHQEDLMTQTYSGSDPDVCKNKSGQENSSFPVRLTRSRCRPATSALSAFSLVAYLARVILCCLHQPSPEGGLLDKSLSAQCLLHLLHLLLPHKP
jgi:hypothetical protein